LGGPKYRRKEATEKTSMLVKDSCEHGDKSSGSNIIGELLSGYAICGDI
jgi:hypothetical protein